MGSSIALKVSPDFKKEVRLLMNEWKPIKEGYANLARQQLNFAKMIADLWETAKSLDKGTGDSLHKDYMRQQLQTLVQSEDPVIFTRWQTIGNQADRLMPLANNLPSNRDHLYQLAHAVKNEKPIDEWIRAGKVHPGVSVNEIKFLKSEGVRKKSVAKATRTQSVTFNFSSDIEAKEIVQVLRQAFESDKFESVIAQQSVTNECKDVLRDIYDRLEPKFIHAKLPKAPSKPRKRRKVASQ
jgi:hypothetical protein